MDYKDELIGELADNVEYYEVLDLLDMRDDVDFEFNKYLEDLTDNELINMFEDYCYDYDEFLDDQKLECGSVCLEDDEV